MGFLSSCAKWLLFASNFLIFALSCAGLGLGIWILVDKSSFLDLLDQTDATVHIYESTAVLILIYNWLNHNFFLWMLWSFQRKQVYGWNVFCFAAGFVNSWTRRNYCWINTGS